MRAPLCSTALATFAALAGLAGLAGLVGCGQGSAGSGDTAATEGPDPGGPTGSAGIDDGSADEGDDTDTGTGDDGEPAACAGGPVPGEICLWFDRVLQAGNVPTAVRVVDVDADGNRDVLITTFEGEDLLVFRKDAGLGFADVETYVVGQGHRHLVDFELGDPDAPDLVLANLFTGSLSLVRNDGEGGFGPPNLIGVGAGTPRYLARGDVDGDGVEDLIAANEDGGVLYFRRVPGGILNPFEAPVPYETGEETYQAELVDMNGDGVLDVVALDRGTDNVAVMLGDGEGSFSTPMPHPVGHGPRGMAVGDIDGDGDLDVVVANFDDGTMHTLQNDGSGALTPLGPPVAAGTGPYGVALADMDEDGDLDAVVPISGVDAVGIFPNLGDGQWGEGLPFPVGGTPLAVVVTDLDGDGRPEVLSIDATSAGVTLLRSTPPG